MGDIGPIRRKVEIIPTTEPVIAPPKEPKRSHPAAPEPPPQKVPTKETA